MSYLVLARKYRPQVFEDIVGQTQVTRTLGNAIISGRVAHAYLFCGPRGVGKTTAARILAKALNCEKASCETPPSPVPCNECSMCRSVTGGTSLDVLEIDGASNRGINEVRELRENTRYAPGDGATKVYIIDEVHMLTNEAFNALLKTLEEPPDRVIFVFATTEPFKVPGTILSRCQRFDFARIPSREIAAHLAAIMGSEDLEAAPEALTLVARRARGGLRDALSLMDQVISAATGPIDRERVETILGLVGEDVFFDLADAVADGDAGRALGVLHEVYGSGADLGEVAEGLALHFRDLTLLRLDAGLTDLLEAAAGDPDRYSKQADRFSPETLQDLLDRMARTAAALRRSEHPRLTLEVALADMAQAATSVPLGELGRRLLELEQRLGGANPGSPVGAARSVTPAGGRATVSQPAAPRATAPPPSETEAPAAGTLSPARASSPRKSPAKSAPSAAGGADAQSLWREGLQHLKTVNIRLWGTLAEVPARGLEDGVLILDPGKDNMLRLEALREKESRDIILGALGAAGMERPAFELASAPSPASRKPRAKTKPKATTQTKGVPEAAAGSDDAAPGEEAPAPTDDRSMAEIFKQEPKLQKVIDLFDGEVLP